MTGAQGTGNRARLESSTFITPLPWRFTDDILSPEAVKKVHEASLEVLERTGVKMTSKTWLKNLADAGCRVDFEDERVWFAPEFVEEKIKLAPSEFLLGARDPNLDFQVGIGQTYLSTDGCQPDILDWKTQERRRGRKDDLAEITRLADALPGISFHWQPVSATDQPDYVRPMHEVEAQLPATAKHIQQMTVVDPWNARGMIEMLEVITGSSQALRERPLMSNFQCAISPLSWEGDPLDAISVLAEAGIPVGMCSMPLAGATGPSTVAGVITIANAEILSGIAALQTIYPGHPTFYINYATTMNMNTGDLNLGWGPEDLTAEMTCGQMGRFYGIPSIAGIYGTGAKRPDWQAGVQNSMSGLAKVLSPADMVTAAGSLYGCNVYSMEELVLDTEIWDLTSKLLKGFDFDEEHLAVDVMDHVGPASHFLGEEHTRDHMRDFWVSPVFNRDSWENWEEAGKPDPSEHAHERVKEILETHEPLPLAEDQTAELRKIVDTYQKERAEED